MAIGPEDVVDGKIDLTLGLVWSIIHFFAIQQIQIQVAVVGNEPRVEQHPLLRDPADTSGNGGYQPEFLLDFSFHDSHNRSF